MREHGGCPSGPTAPWGCGTGGWELYRWQRSKGKEP
jgi:hypothetical protein